MDLDRAALKAARAAARNAWRSRWSVAGGLSLAAATGLSAATVEAATAGANADPPSSTSSPTSTRSPSPSPSSQSGRSPAVAASVDGARPAPSRRYDIPAGPLSRVLTRLAGEAGVLLSVDGRLLDGRPAAGVQGELSIDEAFSRALAGSGLEAVRDGARYTVRPRAPAAAAAAPSATAGAGGTARSAAVAPDTVLAPIVVRAEVPPGPYRAERSSTPTRTDTPLMDLPQSITVLTRELIRDQAMQGMADVLAMVPGVGSAQGEGNRDTAVFRGYSSTADFLLDGLRDDMQYVRDLYGVERIEVLRGPDAMRFGSGGVGGAVNRVGKRPLWQDEGEASLQLGSWQGRRMTLDVNRVADDAQSAWRLNLLDEAARSYRDGFHLHRVGLRPQWSLRLAPRSTLTLGVEHFQDRRTADRGIPSLGGRPLETDPGRFFGNPDASVTWYRQNAFSVDLDHAFDGGWTLQHRARAARNDKFFQNVFVGSVRATTQGDMAVLMAHNSRTLRTSLESQTVLSRGLDLAGQRHELLVGLDLGRRDTANRRQSGFFNGDRTQTTVLAPLDDARIATPVDFVAGPNDVDNVSRAVDASVYLQDRWTLATHWQLLWGLRRERLAIAVDDRRTGQRLRSVDQPWSPRVGLVWRPTGGVSVYASRSAGYLPRAGEQLSSLTVVGAALAPERYVNHELGVKLAPAEGLEATATLYRLDRNRVAVTDPASPTQMTMLVDGQRSDGLEIGVSGRLSANWHTMLAYAWQHSVLRRSLSATARAGASLPHVPRHSVSWWNRWSLGPAWSLGLGVVQRTQVYAALDNTVVLPGFTRFDAALTWRPAPDWRLQLNVENLADRRYALYAHSNSNITPGSPRAARLTLGVEF